MEFCEKIKLSKGPLRLASQHLFVGLDWDAEKNADFIVLFFFKHFHLVKKVAKKGRKYRYPECLECFSSSPGHLCSEGHQGSFATGLARTPNGPRISEPCDVPMDLLIDDWPCDRHFSSLLTSIWRSKNTWVPEGKKMFFEFILFIMGNILEKKQF